MVWCHQSPPYWIKFFFFPYIILLFIYFYYYQYMINPTNCCPPPHCGGGGCSSMLELCPTSVLFLPLLNSPLPGWIPATLPQPSTLRLVLHSPQTYKAAAHLGAEPLGALLAQIASRAFSPLSKGPNCHSVSDMQRDCPLPSPERSGRWEGWTDIILNLECSENVKEDFCLFIDWNIIPIRYKSLKANI